MTTISTLPTAPSRSDPATFATRADAFVDALGTFVTQTNTVAGEVNTNATNASTSAATATTQASNASASATAAANSASGAASAASVTKWASGSYNEGFCVWSPTDFQTYRAKTTGSKPTDPNADSTNWEKITGLTAYVFCARDEKASGTSGGDTTSGTTYTRTLNTVATNTISGASLASDIITLPAGTYDVVALVPSVAVGQSYLYNHTDSSNIIIGTSAYGNSGPGSSEIRGRFTLAASKGIKIQHKAMQSSTGGLGRAVAAGFSEVYTTIWLTKVA